METVANTLEECLKDIHTLRRKKEQGDEEYKLNILSVCTKLEGAIQELYKEAGEGTPDSNDFTSVDAFIATSMEQKYDGAFSLKIDKENNDGKN